ncbi:transglycosylase SLT domain-containing protein [Candidatus Gracilibacteria bacterium]|nr:transglycosylase SLT domain-containing protein [Candidatus Gracilibacteria bacterium]
MPPELTPKNQEITEGERAIGKVPSKENHSDFANHEKDLLLYFKNQSREKIAPETFTNFEMRLEKWDKENDVEKIRSAGVTEKENETNPYLRHALLSRKFLEQLPGSKYVFKVNFKNNHLAEWRVGVGDMLPPNVLKIRIARPDGSSIVAVRAQNPQTKRIGYYDEDLLRKGVYYYEAVHSGDQVEILETNTIPTAGNLQTFREHIAIYRGGAMKESASDGDELRYDANNNIMYRNVETALRARDQDKAYEERQKKAGPNAAATGIATEIDHHHFEKVGRDFWRVNVGNSEAAAASQLEEITFLGGKTKVCRYLIPYLKEANARIKAAGLEYKAKDLQCFAWRQIREGSGQSMHSWGVAIDINPGINQFKSDKTDIPREIIEIMERCGFRWGGHWNQFGMNASPVWGNQWGRPDPMHFEFALNPFTSGAILQSEEAKQAARDIETRSNGRKFVQKEIAPEPKPANYTQTAAYEKRDNKKYPGKETIERACSQWMPFVEASSQKYGVPAELIMAIIYRESGGRANAVGLNKDKGTGEVKSRDQGLMQLNSNYFKNPNIMDPAVNIDTGTKVLKGLLIRYNWDVAKVAQAYNCGHAEGEIIRGRPSGIPALTRDYCNQIVDSMQKLGYFEKNREA